METGRATGQAEEGGDHGEPDSREAGPARCGGMGEGFRDDPWHCSGGGDRRERGHATPCRAPSEFPYNPLCPLLSGVVAFFCKKG